MSSALYEGGRSNGPGARADLDGATLVLALLVPNTADPPCEMLVVRMLRDRSTPTRWAGAPAGAGIGKGSRAVAE